MGCSNCSNGKVFARGLCSGCYTRERRNGSLIRINVQNSGKCAEDGCTRAAFAKNLCKLHYDRARHPLTNAWKLLRSRNTGMYPAEWDRFEVFLSEVGEQPGPRHQLRRRDIHAAYSKENVRWVEPALQVDCMTPEDRSKYERAWRLQRKFGITVEEYDGMLAEQNGVCGICRNPSEKVHRKTGKVRDLAVDHNHAMGVVRGLLCTDCNMAIGLLRDNTVILRAAAAYLDRHAIPTREEIAA